MYLDILDVILDRMTHLKFNAILFHFGLDDTNVSYRFIGNPIKQHLLQFTHTLLIEWQKI